MIHLESSIFTSAAELPVPFSGVQQRAIWDSNLQSPNYPRSSYSHSHLTYPLTDPTGPLTHPTAPLTLLPYSQTQLPLSHGQLPHSHIQLPHSLTPELFCRSRKGDEGESSALKGNFLGERACPTAFKQVGVSNMLELMTSHVMNKEMKGGEITHSRCHMQQESFMQYKQ